MATNGQQNAGADEGKKFLLDPYKEWAQAEGIPIHLDFGHDLISLETGPWARYDARGCFAHTHSTPFAAKAGCNKSGNCSRFIEDCRPTPFLAVVGDVSLGRFHGLNARLLNSHSKIYVSQCSFRATANL